MSGHSYKVVLTNFLKIKKENIGYKIFNLN